MITAFGFGISTEYAINNVHPKETVAANHEKIGLAAAAVFEAVVVTFGAGGADGGTLGYGWCWKPASFGGTK